MPVVRVTTPTSIKIRRVWYIPPAPIHHGLGTAILDHNLGTNEATSFTPVSGLKTNTKIQTFLRLEDSTSDHDINVHGYYDILAKGVAEVDLTTPLTFVNIPKSRTSKQQHSQPQETLVISKNNPLAKGLGFAICGNNHYINNTLGGNWTIPSDIPLIKRDPQKGGITCKSIGMSPTTPATMTLSDANSYTIFCRFFGGKVGSAGGGEAFVSKGTTYDIGIALASGSSTFIVYLGSGGSWAWTGAIPTIPDIWNTVSVSYTPTLTRIYLNGVSYGDYTATALGASHLSFYTYWFYSGSEDNHSVLTGVYHRDLVTSEHKSLHDNPYQIFEPDTPRLIPVPRESGIPQGIKITSLSPHKLNGKFQRSFVWVN